MSAIISACGKYRYRLSRELDSGNVKPCVFIMLNPSTADAESDDPTIRRCKGFAAREDCGQLIVVNLFAWRATKPSDLYREPARCGVENDSHIFGALGAVAEWRGIAIAAWGANPTDGRDWRVQKIAERHGVPLMCLGKTAGGAPRHPLYVSRTQPLEFFALKGERQP